MVIDYAHPRQCFILVDLVGLEGLEGLEGLSYSLFYFYFIYSEKRENPPDPPVFPQNSIIFYSFIQVGVISCKLALFVTMSSQCYNGAGTNQLTKTDQYNYQFTMSA